ncbi:MAG TPA: hypothetical protein VK907_05325, partial [Phnomibacter sp.]|nr:hypothetical protein [Phnomibacter sp.]
MKYPVPHMGLVWVVIFSLIVNASFSQKSPKAEGGGLEVAKVVCIDEKRSSIIKAELQASLAELETKGLALPVDLTSTVKFDWPVRLSSKSKDPSFFGVSNYVDHDPEYPNKVRDYMCGTRTYDLASGYNHRGLDIFALPFAQLGQLNNLVEIVAAAPGTIINKLDGNPDNNCSFCTNCMWNAVYIRHADGSIAWYGHLKSGSLTSKPVGSEVIA